MPDELVVLRASGLTPSKQFIIRVVDNYPQGTQVARQSMHILFLTLAAQYFESFRKVRQLGSVSA
jgi:hypothetical protein